MLAYHDGAAGQHRYAAFRDGCLSGALFVAPQPVAAARNWLIGRIGQKVADPRDRLRLLAGRAGEAGAEHGAIICSRSEEHTSELQSLMRISYAVFCLKKKKSNK